MPVIAPPAPSLPGVAHTSGCTTVIAVAELFEGTGSAGAEALIDAVFEIEPAFAGAFTVIVMVSIPPTARTPMLQVTVAVPLQVTPAGTADDETNIVVAGMVSLNVALVVATGPRFCTLMV